MITPHDHNHHEHGHSHAHSHPSGVLGLLQSIIAPHSHDAVDKVDSALESHERGIWAVRVSLAVLGMAALFQLVIAIASGSVGLLADTIHNFSDALTAIPLWIAFALGRRAATRRYTYGYGRAEDLAGVFIVLMIILSAGLAGWQALQRLLNPQPLENVGWVIAAAIVGFLGNEAVATFRIRVGKEIGSAALVADGYHARTDGFTSLAVLLGAIGALAGYPLADPIVGLGITAAILLVLKNALRDVWHRLMDAVDPDLVHRLEQNAHLYGVQEIRDLRARWLGHSLEAELTIVVNGELSTRSSHAIAESVRHALFHTEQRLVSVIVHVDPAALDGADHHAATAHHNRRRPRGHRDVAPATIQSGSETRR